ncbi:hypothetical protein ILYODFUR_010585 [Ilyodon furcidens]|uniref:Uncharacterized protein n=1 Tax=Ilyodon furcidens TaxID=33524 RepID=A0ABV0T891_9TELE
MEEKRGRDHTQTRSPPTHNEGGEYYRRKTERSTEDQTYNQLGRRRGERRKGAAGKWMVKKEGESHIVHRVPDNVLLN